MNAPRLRNLLDRVHRGELTPAAAEAALADELRALPFEDLGFARVDHHRALRQGFPEVILGLGKTPAQIAAIAERIVARGQTLLVTRAEQAAYDDAQRQAAPAQALAAKGGKKKKQAWPEVPSSAKREGIFDPKCPATPSAGCLPGGIGWYRKTFILPPGNAGRSVWIEFEGVYMNSDVWLNGHHLGNRPYGYSSFHYDLAPYLRSDALNVLAVRVNVEQPCSRWYSGAGIYRHVWLTTASPVHVAPWGTCITTPEITATQAAVRVRTTVRNADSSGQAVTLRTRKRLRGLAYPL
jgi:hypothetical protein